MKKHIVVTVVIIVIFLLFFEVFLWFRGEHEESGSVNTFVSRETENGSQSDTEEMTVAAGTEEPEQTDAESEADAEEGDRLPTMLFTGDVLFATHVREHYSASGIGAVISQEFQDLFRNADIAMVNQEFPFSLRGVPMEDKQYTFRIDPAFVTLFGELGVDVVSLANNHVLDYGRDALTDTFATLDEAGIRYAGAGESEERAQELQTFQVNGKTIGILSASRVIPVVGWDVANNVPGVFTTYDGTKLCEEIRKAKEICDFVAVYVHWGVEYEAYPQEYQRELARQYIDAGADFVAGAHSHCLQSIEFYNGKPVFYGLGNFVFDAEIERTLAIEVTVSPEDEAECRLIPAKAVSGCTMRMDGAEADELYRYLEGISEGIVIDGQGVLRQK